MGIIYCLTFKNGKKYIGQTIQPLYTRLKQHSSQHYCTAVHNAIKKYKEYTCDILLEVKNEELDYYEEKLIHEYNTIIPSGYNIRTGGKSSKFCDEIKKKMSNSHKGKSHSMETKLAISKALSGRTLDQCTKEKISDSKKRIILSDEAKKRMSRCGMKHTDEAKNKVSLFNKGKTVAIDTREKLSQSLRQNGKNLNLPLYVHRKEQKLNSYHGSGFKSKSFISKKLSDEEKYRLAINYLNNIQYDKCSTTK